MAIVNPQPRLPMDANGYPIQTGHSATTGTSTLLSGSGADDIAVPAGAVGVILWSTVAWGFKGIGSAAGTEVDVPANVFLSLGCAGGGTVFVDQGSGGAGTLNYIFVMGDNVNNS